jgi:Tol biopolymer transport system component
MSPEREDDCGAPCSTTTNHVFGASDSPQVVGASCRGRCLRRCRIRLLTRIGGAAARPLGQSASWSDLYALAADWSPRGRYILLDLENRTTEKLHLELFDLASPDRSLQDLTPSAVRAYEAAWSPDGRRLVFGASDPATSSTTRLYVMGAMGATVA